MNSDRKTGHRLRRYRGAAVVVAFGLAAFGLSWRIMLPVGLIGNHWDWGIPSSPAELANMAHSTAFAWFPVSLGSYVSFRYGLVVLEILLGTPGYLGISGGTVAKTMILVDMWASGLSMYFLLWSLRSAHAPRQAAARWVRYVPPAAAGLMYMGSPFQFDQIIAGDIGGLAAYAILPLAVALFWKGAGFSCRATKRPLVASAVVFGAAFALSTQPTMMAAIISLGPLLVLESRRVQLLLRAVVVGAIGLIVNAFWLLPALVGSRTIATAVAVTPAAGNPYAHYSSLLASIEGWTYFVTFLWNGLSVPEQHIWAGMCMVVIAGAIAIVLLQRTEVPRKSYWMGVCLVVEFAIAVVVAAPSSVLGAPVRRLLHVPLLSLIFRTPQHLVFPVAILTPILVGVGLQRSISSTTFASRARYQFALPPVAGLGCVAVIGVVAAFPLSTTITGYIGPFHESASSAAAQRYLNTHGVQDGRLLVLPGGTSEYFQRHPPGAFFLDGGDDANALWDVHPAISLDTKWNPSFNARLTERLLVDQLITYPLSAGALLDQLAVQYIELAPVASPTAGPLLGQWKEYRVRASLLQDHQLQEVFGRGGWYIFENKQFSSQLMSVTAIGGDSGALADAAIASGAGSTVADVTGPSAQSGPRAFTMLTAGNYLSSTVVRYPPAHLIATRLVPQSGHNGVIIYRLPTQLPGCFLYDSQARVVFRARAARTGTLMVLLPDATDSARAFEALRPVGPGSHVYSIALSEFSPVANPSLATIRDVSFLAVTPPSLQRRHIGLTVSNVGLQHPVPQGCSRVNDSGWIIESEIPPAPWNYFEGVRQSYAVIGTPVSSHNRLFLRGRVRRAGSYELELALVAPGVGWAMRLEVSGAKYAVGATGGAGGDRYEFVRLGRTNLAAGSLTARVVTECKSGCQVGVIGLLAVPRLSAAASRPTCETKDVRERNPGAFTSRIVCPAWGTIALSETRASAWQAVAHGARGTSVVLRHVTVGGWENGWEVPPGTWQVTIAYTMQFVYVVGRLITLVVVAALTGYCVVGSGGVWFRPRRTSIDRVGR